VTEIRLRGATIPRGDHRVAQGTAGGAHGFGPGQSGRARGRRRNECLRSSCRAAGHRSARGSEDAARRHSGRGIPASERKVDEQYQTKVESASKYRMRLSGIVLLNLFSNWGRWTMRIFRRSRMTVRRGDREEASAARYGNHRSGLKCSVRKWQAQEPKPICSWTLEADFRGR